MTVSCLYEGQVVHRRFEPVQHLLRYRVAMLLLDLEELPSLCTSSRIWSASRPALLRFRRADHLGDASVPLLDAVRSLVASSTGRVPSGPVRLLTTPRWFGAGFNPISVYYCHDEADEPPVAAVFEVSNTPWREMHPYVLDLRTAAGPDTFSGVFAKRMHVSPFLPMDIDYHWTLTAPNGRLRVAIECQREGRRVMTAALNARRAAHLSPASLRRYALRIPPMYAVTVGGIHWNALKLRAKGARYHAHPARA